MATYNRKDRRRVEDWTAAVKTNVIPDGQFRWYDGVTGYNAAEVIEMVGDGSITIASLPKRQPATDGAQTLYGIKTFNAIPLLPSTTPSSVNQATRKGYVDGLLGETFDVVNTNSGDVAATTPSSPANGEKWIVFNSGTSGNHVTGLPNSITLGDLKTLHLKYDNTNTQWIYEDVTIDEYISGNYTVIKSSGGRLKIIGRDTPCNSISFPENFVDANYSIVGSTDVPSNTTFHVASFSTRAVGSVTCTVTTSAGSGVTQDIQFIAEGRWKTGI